MTQEFPILRSWNSDERKHRDALGCPTSIPWDMIAPHERQADRNHYQTLKRLAERGGLSPAEAVAVLEDREYRQMGNQEAADRLKAMVEAWRLEQAGRRMTPLPAKVIAVNNPSK